MPQTRTYSLEDCTLVFNKYIVTGFVKGEILTVAFDDVDWDYQQGTDGEIVRYEKVNRLGVITAKLMRSSPANARLSAMANEDLLYKTGPFALQFKDSRLNTIVSGDGMSIQKQPDLSFGEEAGSREWPFKGRIKIEDE